MKFSILCPTRKRVASVARLLNSFIATTSKDSDLEFLFYIDYDDEDSSAALKDFKNQVKDLNIEIKIFRGKRIFLTAMSNYLANRATGDFLWTMGDDVVMATKNWDKLVVNEFAKYEDKILVVFGKDFHQNEKLCTHPIFHRNWYSALGYLVPSIFPGDWSDCWINEVAEKLNRRIYLEDFHTPHLHAITGQSSWDQTYLERMQTEAKNNPEKIYNENADLREENYQTLKNFIENFEND